MLPPFVKRRLLSGNLSFPTAGKEVTFVSMDNEITIKQLLGEMEAGRPFSLSFVTANKQKGTGGRIMSVTGALLSGYNLPSGTKLTGSVMNKATAHGRASKRPNHSNHFTRNILLPDLTLVTVHIDLITRFNGKKIL